MLKFLIVEDEKPIADLIAMSLSGASCRCVCESDGMAAADRIERETFDLILLDVMLPGLDGFSLMEYIRPREIPVIFLTARGSVSDRVRGLRAGADDYLVKPFEIIELQARVETVLRRYHKLEREIVTGGLTIDVQSRTVQRDGAIIPLTMKEYELLLLFARNPGIALYRETIYERVWESDWLGDSRTVDLHVQRLRRKVGWEDKIRAVYKVGYRYEP